MFLCALPKTGGKSAAIRTRQTIRRLCPAIRSRQLMRINVLYSLERFHFIVLAGRYRKMARIRSRPDRNRLRRCINNECVDRTGGNFVIVCSCNVISDHQVRSVTAERTVRGTSDIYRCLGCSAECGRCARTIRRIVEEALTAAASPAGACDCVCAASKTRSSGNSISIAPALSPST